VDDEQAELEQGIRACNRKSCFEFLWVVSVCWQRREANEEQYLQEDLGTGMIDWELFYMVHGAMCELISASSLAANRTDKPYLILSAVQPACSEQPGMWETKEM
jgi:hypothetical protein